MVRLTKRNQATKYISQTFAQEDHLLSKVGKDLPECELCMQLAPEEGKLLQVLVKMSGAKKIVELGVLAGYSAICMARGMPEDGKIYAIDKNYKRIGPSKRNFAACGVDHMITLLEGEAIEMLHSIEQYGPFDMIFIDADKASYELYLDWSEKHIRQGGVIVGDNTLLFGAMYGEPHNDVPEQTIRVMENFNNRLADQKKYCSILVPTLEGMTVAIKLF